MRKYTIRRQLFNIAAGASALVLIVMLIAYANAIWRARQFPMPADPYASSQSEDFVQVRFRISGSRLSPTFVFAATAFLPTVWLVLFLGRRFRNSGNPITRCRRCAYDLTGNVSGACPACGTAVPSNV